MRHKHRQFDNDEWDSENRHRIAAHYQARPDMPDDYDWQDAIQKAADLVAAKWERYDKPEEMNLWAADLPSMVTPEDVWEFFDYPEFAEVVRRGTVTGRVSDAIKVLTLDPFPQFPAASGPWAIWGVTDVWAFPSRFNNLQTETDPYGTPVPLQRWFVIVTPRTKRLAQALGRKDLHTGSYTAWERAQDAFKYDLAIWRDNTQTPK
jgi:hypothetical protein